MDATHWRSSQPVAALQVPEWIVFGHLNDKFRVVRNALHCVSPWDLLVLEIKMAVKVVKVRGEDIPLELRAPGVDQVYKITGADGHIYHRQDDVEAARLAVNLSDIARSKLAC
jgi:hypothetical protein